jgi:hypothetical protein
MDQARSAFLAARASLRVEISETGSPDGSFAKGLATREIRKLFGNAHVNFILSILLDLIMN